MSSIDDEEVAGWYAEQRLSDDALARLLAAGADGSAARRWRISTLVQIVMAAIIAVFVGVYVAWPRPEEVPTIEPMAALDPVYVPEPEPAPLEVPADMRRTVVPISDGAALSGFLRPGNYVDVLRYVPPTGPGERPQTTTVLKAVQVAEVMQGKRERGPRITRVALLTTPEQEEVVLDAAARGEIVLVLRNDLDVDFRSLPGVDIDDLRTKLTITKKVVRPTASRRASSTVPVPRPTAPPVPLPPSRRTEIPLERATATDRDPVSTFALDVDTASYAVVREQITAGFRPDPAVVRIEELVNALPYDYPRPTDALFDARFEVAPSPWTAGHHLVRIGIRARDLPDDRREPLHLTLLVDTSGSMDGRPLDLVKHSLAGLIGLLRPSDTVAIVQFGDEARLVAPPTSDPYALQQAIAGLRASGSTALEAGLLAAYPLAAGRLDRPGTHRVVLCTDGMANVGEESAVALADRVRPWTEQGIALTALGFGMRGYRDALMEAFADRSDGNYAYVDTPDEARRVLQDQLMETMLVVARDAKAQVTWDPARVETWRLVGYDDRRLEDRQFRDDAVDAGELGPGHRVTALYEVRLTPDGTGSLGALDLRAEPPGPEGQRATEQRFRIDVPVRPSLDEASADFRMAVAAASFALNLRGADLGGMDLDAIVALARRAARPEYPEDRQLVDLMVMSDQPIMKHVPGQRCREFTIVSGGKKKVILVDEGGNPCW